MNILDGKTEFDIFNNYYTAEKSKQTRLFINTLPLKSKDNVESERLRRLVKEYFTAREFHVCLKKYTESLLYATCNGREYAMALANRSATYFAMNNYKNCLIDINLCLQAAYPINLKPKMLIRKARCFIKMGKIQEMIETIDDCCKQIQDNSNLPKLDKDNYMKEIRSIMEIKQIDIEELPFEEISLPPEVIREENPLNPNVSASIEMKSNANAGTDYVAKRDIPCGEVLFLDTPYSIGFMHDVEFGDISSGFFFCDYCWNEANNCIPCKSCVPVLYCSENCRDNSWNDYHQWECDMFRSGYISGDSCITLRTVIKAVRSGAIFQISNNTKPLTSSNNMDPYLYIYNLHVNLENHHHLRCLELIETNCQQTVGMIESLKKTNFFAYILSTSSCQKDYPTLVNFLGGLLFRHNIQMFERMLTIRCTSPIVAVNEIQGELELLPIDYTWISAYCPAVSELKYSCESNTSMYFNRGTCIVKACKNIKAGDNIFRSNYNFTPMMPFLLRKKMMQDIFVNCNCAACEDVAENIDFLNTFLCTECGRFAVMHLLPSDLMVCKNCKRMTNFGAFQLMIDNALAYSFVSGNIDVTQYSNELAASLNTIKKVVNPNHQYMYNLYKEFLLLYSKQEGIDEFKKALQNFKTCAEKRHGRFNILKYVIDDLTLICQACFAYLQLNKLKLQKQEIKEVITYFTDVVNEAKEIANYTFPPLLYIFAKMEFYMLKFNITHVTLKD